MLSFEANPFEVNPFEGIPVQSQSVTKQIRPKSISCNSKLFPSTVFPFETIPFEGVTIRSYSNSKQWVFYFETIPIRSSEFSKQFLFETNPILSSGFRRYSVSKLFCGPYVQYVLLSINFCKGSLTHYYVCIHYIWEERSKVLKAFCRWHDKKFLSFDIMVITVCCGLNAMAAYTVTEMVDMVFAFGQSGGS